jgi:glycosyltransferase involved in cell wall biosynthesis
MGAGQGAPVRVTVWSPYMGHIGTIRAVLNISKGLRAEGLDVDLIRVRDEFAGAEPFLRENDIQLVDFRGAVVFPVLPRHGKGYRFSMAVLSLFSFPILWWYLQRRKPDVLLVCLLGFLPMLVLRFSPHRPKVVLSVQGIPTFNRFRRFLWRNLQFRSDAVIPLTENTRQLLLKQGMSSGLLHRIDNPVIDDGILESAREPAGHPWLDAKDRPVLMGIGRLSRQKDFSTLLRAFALLRARTPCRLVILGEGEDRSRLEAEVKTLGLQHDVLLAGFVANPYKWLARADVFVLTSLWEDPGHVLMEAAFLNIPIVATDCPSGPRDFLDSGALGSLCPMGDAEAIASAVESTLRVPDADRVRRAHAKSLNYTIPVCVHRYAHLMKELVS